MIEYHSTDPMHPDTWHMTQAIHDATVSKDDVMITWLGGGEAAIVLSQESLLKIRESMNRYRDANGFVPSKICDLILKGI